MEETRTEKSIKNVVTGIIYKIVGILFPFLIRTVMIQKLGSEYLGLNSLFTSILQVLSLSELGIGTAMVYSMYKPMAENNTSRICSLLSVYRKLYRIIGCIILIIGLILLPFLEYFISGDYPQDINIYLIYLIYLFNTVISYFLFAYKKSILDALQKVSIENLINTITTAIMYILQLVTLYFTKNYYIYILFLPISTIALNVIRNIIIVKKYPQYICKGDIEKGFIKDLYSNIKALIGHKIGSTVLWFSDSIVISSFLGLNILAIYSNYYYIMNAIIGVMAIIYNSILASIGNSLVTESTEKNHRDFMMFTFGNCWLVGVCSVCLLCLYQPFMKLWMGTDMMFDFHIVILFVVYFYSWLFSKIGNTYENAAGMWKLDFYKPYVSAITNLVLNIVLVNIIGISGVLISTIISSVIVEATWETFVLYKYLFKRSPKEYIIKLIKYTLVIVIACIITYYICTLIHFGDLLSLILKTIICLIVPNIIFTIIYYRTEEFRNTVNKIKNILHIN